MVVVAEAENGRRAVQLVRELKPDVVIMDIHMPDLNGIDATCRIISDFPEVKVIGLSMYSDRQFVTGMFKAGAAGYLLKANAYGELVRAVQSVIANQAYLGSGIDKVAGLEPS
jgi:DNA-binding NarL/FixJ family response regulator